MAVKKRVYQVAERIREIVAGSLNRTADPRFNLVTVTSVVVTPDLRIAKVYWVVSVADPAERKDRIAEVQTAFENAAGLFKRACAQEMGLRFVPDLKFFYDDTLDMVEEVERVLAKARQSGMSSAEDVDESDRKNTGQQSDE